MEERVKKKEITSEIQIKYYNFIPSLIIQVINLYIG